MKRHVHYWIATTLIMFLLVQISSPALANFEPDVHAYPSVTQKIQANGAIISFTLNPDDVTIDPEEEDMGTENDPNALKGRLTAPGILKKLNGNFHLDILAKGNAKRIKMNRGKDDVAPLSNGKSKAPGQQKKTETSAVSNGQGKGRMGKDNKFTASGAWSGLLLDNIEPLEVDDRLISDFGVNVEDLQAFEEAYPSVLPLYPTYITSDFGKRRDPKGKGMDFHDGVDLKADYQAVWATGSGLVTFAGYQDGYGYVVELDHGFGIVTRYAHNSQILVDRGQTVNRYHVIAISGNSGNSTGPHLHYEIEINGIHQNPISIIYDRSRNE